MSDLYLAASLPPLSLDKPPPLTREELLFQAQGVLSERAYRDLELVVAGRAGEGASTFCAAWCAVDTQIRNAMVRMRAAKRHADPKQYLHEERGHSGYAAQAISDAGSAKDPLARERVLDECRWYLVDDLAAADPLGLPGILAYAVKLMLVERWARIDDEAGRKRMDDFIQENLERRGARTEFNIYAE